jgi:hypothetical protein
MTSKGIKTSAQGAIVAAGKSAAEGAKAAAGVVLDNHRTLLSDGHFLVGGGIDCVGRGRAMPC